MLAYIHAWIVWKRRFKVKTFNGKKQFRVVLFLTSYLNISSNLKKIRTSDQRCKKVVENSKHSNLYKNIIFF